MSREAIISALAINTIVAGLFHIHANDPWSEFGTRWLITSMFALSISWLLSRIAHWLSQGD